MSGRHITLSKMWGMRRQLNYFFFKLVLNEAEGIVQLMVSFLLLQDEICFCVEDLSEVIRVPPRRCSKPCWKIRDQRCGGDEANSMYERGQWSR